MARIESRRKRGGSRRRISEKERSDWLERARAGETEAQIATSARVQPRTIRKHLAIARSGADQELVRRDVLRRAVEDHQREDLLRTATQLLDGLRQQLEGNGLADPKPLAVDGKRALALLSHTQGAGLSRLVRDWKGVVEDWDNAVISLKRELLDDASRSGLTTDGAPTALFETAVLPYVRTGRPEDLDQSWWQPVMNGELRFGAFRVALVGDSDRKCKLAKQHFEMTHGSLPNRELLGTLRSAHVRAAGLREALIDYLEDLCLRRFFDGQCLWCPGIRRRQAQRQQTRNPGHA